MNIIEIDEGAAQGVVKCASLQKFTKKEQARKILLDVTGDSRNPKYEVVWCNICPFIHLIQKGEIIKE